MSCALADYRRFYALIEKKGSRPGIAAAVIVSYLVSSCVIAHRPEAKPWHREMSDLQFRK